MIGDRNPKPAASPDGYHWKLLSGERITSGEESHLTYDELGQQFLLTTRARHEGRRAVGLSTSKDFVTWTEPKLIYYADEEYQKQGRKWLARHLSDPTKRKPLVNNPEQYNVQIYNMGIFPYEGLYIGLPTIFRVCGHSKKAPASDGFSETGLAVSRDLWNWRPVGNRATFIPLATVVEGAYGTAQIEPPSRPIRHGDELWFYYSALKYRYSPNHRYDDPDSGAICLAKLRLDGFVSFGAAEAAGTILTRPLAWKGASLWVNADVTGGELHVEVLNADARPLNERFSRQQAIAIENNGVRIPVRWRSGADLHELEGKTVRLRFNLRRGRLYAFWTE